MRVLKQYNSVQQSTLKEWGKHGANGANGTKYTDM
jgi:hypothetical protein